MIIVAISFIIIIKKQKSQLFSLRAFVSLQWNNFSFKYTRGHEKEKK